jgi:hypothetical protein
MNLAYSLLRGEEIVREARTADAKSFRAMALTATQIKARN